MLFLEALAQKSWKICIALINEAAVAANISASIDGANTEEVFACEETAHEKQRCEFQSISFEGKRSRSAT